MKHFVLSPEAEQDLDDIKSYLMGKAGLQVTRYVVSELRSAIQFLAKTPGAGHLRKTGISTLFSIRTSLGFRGFHGFLIR